MSMPAPPRPDDVVHPTRQQLDELDAMIRHMLALPADQADGPPAPGAPVASGPAHRPEEQSVTPPFWKAALEALALPAAQALNGRGSSQGDDAGGRSPAQPSGDGPRPLERSAVLAATSGGGPPPAEDPEGVRRVLAWPLVGSNELFDRWAGRLGLRGRWLHGVRAVLGWAGLALLATALVWGVLDWIGWI